VETPPPEAVDFATLNKALHPYASVIVGQGFSLAKSETSTLKDCPTKETNESLGENLRVRPRLRSTNSGSINRTSTKKDNQ